MITPRSIAAAAAIVFVGLSAVIMAGAQAEPTDPEPQLCNDRVVTVTNLPYIMRLDDSDTYPDGPRSCDYHGKHRIVYQCNGDPNEPVTYLHVIDNSREERRLIEARCDGQRRVADTDSAYGNSSGPYHVHWHIPALGGWESAYLEIS